MNQYVKTLFDKCKDYLDPEFTEENFDKNTEEQPDRICELLFTEFMLDNLMKMPKNKVSSEGLDLRLEDIARPASNKKNGWAEFICPHHKQDIVENPYKDEDDFLSRITLALQTKNNKIKSDIQKGLVKETEPVIVCINLDQIVDYNNDFFMIAGIAGCLPSVLRSVYPISEVKATINLTNQNKSKIGQDYKSYIRRIKPNKTEIEIPTDVFLKNEYKHISAVLFNYSKSSSKRFILVHNYYAKNPIKRKMFKNCTEFIPHLLCEENKTILSIRKIENKDQ